MWPCLLPPLTQSRFLSSTWEKSLLFTDTKTEMISTGPRTSCVTENELLTPSVPQFSDVKNLGNSSICLWLSKRDRSACKWRQHTTQLILTLVLAKSCCPCIHPQACFLDSIILQTFFKWLSSLVIKSVLLNKIELGAIKSIILYPSCPHSIHFPIELRLMFLLRGASAYYHFLSVLMEDLWFCAVLEIQQYQWPSSAPTGGDRSLG